MFGIARTIRSTIRTVPSGSQSSAEPLALYRELRSVGLDPAKVYRVRDVTLDRQSLHVSLNATGWTKADLYDDLQTVRIGG